MTLTQLANRYGTDKGTLAGPQHGYTPFYEVTFGKLPIPVTNLLEIGILSGASLRMWKEYFPLARIVGLDRAVWTGIADDRITCLEGEQQDPHTLKHVIEWGPFAVIIDDGGHVQEHQITSFKALWPSVLPGGVYIIEDLAEYQPDIFIKELADTPDISHFSTFVTDSAVLEIHKKCV